MPAEDPSDPGRLLDVLDAAGWDLVGWGHHDAAWLFRRGLETRPIVAVTLMEAVRIFLIQEELLDGHEPSGTVSPASER